MARKVDLEFPHRLFIVVANADRPVCDQFFMAYENLDEFSEDDGAIAIYELKETGKVKTTSQYIPNRRTGK